MPTKEGTEALVLAALAPANGAQFDAVQVQKLFFLIDKKAAAHVQGPHFSFEPYNYGPFDRSVYRVLEALAERGLVEIIPGRYNAYRLTEEGQRLGDSHLRAMDTRVADFVAALSGFVRKLSFTQLVSAVYKEYPEMKVNSVFRG